VGFGNESGCRYVDVKLTFFKKAHRLRALYTFLHSPELLGAPSIFMKRDPINESAFKNLIRAAVEFNSARKKKKEKK
jgi:hypothetical protein